MAVGWKNFREHKSFCKAPNSPFLPFHSCSTSPQLLSFPAANSQAVSFPSLLIRSPCYFLITCFLFSPVSAFFPLPFSSCLTEATWRTSLAHSSLSGCKPHPSFCREGRGYDSRRHILAHTFTLTRMHSALCIHLSPAVLSTFYFLPAPSPESTVYLQDSICGSVLLLNDLMKNITVFLLGCSLYTMSMFFF